MIESVHTLWNSERCERETRCPHCDSKLLRGYSIHHTDLPPEENFHEGEVSQGTSFAMACRACHVVWS